MHKLEELLLSIRADAEMLHIIVKDRKDHVISKNMTQALFNKAKEAIGVCEQWKALE